MAEPSVSRDDLTAQLGRPMAPPAPEVEAALAASPIDPADALPRGQIDRLLDPAPMAAETGWCWLGDGVGYVAVRTPMPAVDPAMVSWWFDWHPRDPLRYRIWHPADHEGVTFEAAPTPAADPLWGAIHHPVEDVGTGRERVRIAFTAPDAVGFSADALNRPAFAAIVCGFVGDDRRRVRHSVMAHVWLHADPGLVLRSRFWLGAALRPYAPAALARPAAWALNRPLARRSVLPRRLPAGLARHCAEEYANLAAFLPELYRRHGDAA